MEEISILPDRARFKDYRLKDECTSKFINIYVENLYGVNSVKVNCITATVLITYDSQKISYFNLKNNVENAISSDMPKNLNLDQYNNYFETVKKRDLSRFKFLFYGFLYLLFKSKILIFGRFSFSRNIRFLQIASGITILGGYPIFQRMYGKVTQKISTLSESILKITAFSLLFLREDGLGAFILTLKYLNDYIKFSSDSESLKLFSKSISKNSDMTWVCCFDGQEILVPINSLKPGDIINVHNGEIIPVEGTVLSGEGMVNNLYYTGQPVITSLKKGNTVHEGMTLISGELKIGIKKLPQSIKKQDIDINDIDIYKKVNKLQEKISIISIMISIGNYFITRNILNSLSILLLFCPAALEVALSTGIKNYISLLNKNKLYLRNPNSFEKISNINQIIFDKTGTLTYGKMNISHIESFDHKYSNEDLLKICSDCEINSHHPIVMTFNENYPGCIHVNKVKRSLLIPPKGIKAVYNTHIVLIGNKKLMQKYNINIKNYLNIYKYYEDKSHTPIFVSIDNSLCGIIVLEDILRENAKELMDSLKNSGFENILMLTGDTHKNAYYTASKLGIDAVYANCSAEDKFKILLNNKSKYNVMMIGDGINDVKAMKNSDISVSFADSSCDKIKINSDCIIFEDNILKLSDFLSLSKTSYNKINQSINISTIYNIIFGTLALISPFNPFTAKSICTFNTLLVLFLNKRILFLKSNNKLSRNIKRNGS